MFLTHERSKQKAIKKKEEQEQILSLPWYRDKNFVLYNFSFCKYYKQINTQFLLLFFYWKTIFQNFFSTYPHARTHTRARARGGAVDEGGGGGQESKKKKQDPRTEGLLSSVSGTRAVA